MQRFLKTLLIGLTFWCCTATHAAATDDLIQLLNNIRTMQADFSQTVSDVKGKTINKSQGKMSLARPGKFRWDVTRPTAQLIVTNGKKVWIYDRDLEQLTVRYLTKEAGEAPALLLSNTNATLAQDFHVQATSGSGMQWFLLVPKDKSSMFEIIKLGFANQQIKQMQLQDHLGHVTSVRFGDILMNASLSPALFNFKAPANVDVIDETRR